MRLALGKLWTQAAIIPAKLDQRIRSIVATVNGGLTGNSLSPAYKLPVGAFKENRSTFELVGNLYNSEMAGVAPPGGFCLTPPLPFPARLESVWGVWCAGQLFGSYIYIGKGTPNGFLPIGTGSTLGVNQQEYVGGYPVAWASRVYRLPVSPVECAAGDQILFSGAYLVSVHAGHFVCRFSIPHIG